MIATRLRHDRRCYWIAIGLGMLVAIVVFGSAALVSERLAFFCMWTIIPVASFALGYVEPARYWRWPTIMAVVAGFLVWIPMLYADVRSAELPIAFLWPGILGMITAGVAAALRRSERARIRANDGQELPN